MSSIGTALTCILLNNEWKYHFPHIPANKCIITIFYFDSVISENVISL